MDRAVRFLSGVIPPWDAVRAELGRVGVCAPLRMIDGMPAFPDEVPEAGWQELRLGVPGGMVTVRAASDTLTCVVWGNAAGELAASWNAVCWACASAGGGVVDTPAGPIAADVFARQTGVRPA